MNNIHIIWLFFFFREFLSNRYDIQPPTAHTAESEKIKKNIITWQIFFATGKLFFPTMKLTANYFCQRQIIFASGKFFYIPYTLYSLIKFFI
jgi:hypothetical protein